MDRTPTSPPLNSWQFYSACLHHMGMAVLNTIYCGIKSKKCPHCEKPVTDDRSRQIHRWSADPDTTESHQRNPIDRYETLLNKLMALGHGDIARACVRRQAHVVGCFLSEKNIPVSDKATLAEECLDDLPAMAEFHRVVNDPKSTPGIVRETMASLINEIEQNYDLFCKKRGITP